MLNQRNNDSKIKLDGLAGIALSGSEPKQEPEATVNTKTKIELDASVAKDFKQDIPNENRITKLEAANEIKLDETAANTIKCPITNFNAQLELREHAIKPAPTSPSFFEPFSSPDNALGLGKNFYDFVKYGWAYKNNGFNIEVTKDGYAIIKGARLDTALEEGIKGTRYAFKNAAKYPEVFKFVKPDTAIYDALNPKSISGKWGYGSMLLGIASDTYNNIKEGANGTKIAADAIVDMGFALGNTAFSVGATALTASVMGTPAGFAIGLGASAGSILLTEKKYNGSSIKDDAKVAMYDFINNPNYSWGITSDVNAWAAGPQENNPSPTILAQSGAIQTTEPNLQTRQFSGSITASNNGGNMSTRQDDGTMRERDLQLEIKPGNTLNEVARKQGITTEDIKQTNPLFLDEHTIQAGEKVHIPHVKEQENAVVLNTDAFVRANEQVVFTGQGVSFGGLRNVERELAQSEVQPVGISEVRETLKTRTQEINQELDGLRTELSRLRGEPLTPEQAEQLATTAYCQGENKQLAEQALALKSERKQLDIAEKDLAEYGQRYKMDTLVCRYAPEWLKGEGLKNYEAEKIQLEQQRQNLDKSESEHITKMERLHEKLQAPEARVEIARISSEYLEKDKFRLTQLQPMEARRNELLKENHEIRRLMDTMPYKTWDKKIKIQGDVKDPQHILQQADLIKQQAMKLVPAYTQTVSNGFSFAFQHQLPGR